MAIALKNSVTYGPVNSRRLGRSLGINVFSDRRKCCSFNCLYCQYGLSLSVEPDCISSSVFYAVDRILEEVEQAILLQHEAPQFITFSGHGEPSLHPHFPELVRGINALRNKLCPSAKTAILSNSTTLNKESTRQALSELDVRIMKLDAGDEGTFQRFNRPARNITLDKITQGLKKIPEVTIQTLLAGGRIGNINNGNFAAWIERLIDIKPVAVQLYSLDRDAAVPQLIKITKQSLDNFKIMLLNKNIPVEIY